MKIVIILSLVIFSFNAISGVGGSTGGDKTLKETHNFDFYFHSLNYTMNLPIVEFHLEDSPRVLLPVNEVCVRNNDHFESINEIEITKYDQNKLPVTSEKKIILRDLYTTEETVIRHLFKENEVILNQVDIPLNYIIKVFQSAHNSDRIIQFLKYSIKECE
ncbi:MAG: hypothetical protein H7281_02505 [Bacteriovorax sp.]|nr:hypothetical protein [Bacteriovorax sp.]